MKENNALKKIRSVVDACSDCDCCRPVMDLSCLFFPELYRLVDEEKDTGRGIPASELRRLAELCNFCGLCPCPNIREDIMESKSLFIEKEGLRAGIRLLEDLKLTGSICGAFPTLYNRVLRKGPVSRLLKKATGIHAERKLPAAPAMSFDKTAVKLKLSIKPDNNGGKRAAYFTGCSGRYFFPGVPEAAVDIMKLAGIQVYMPPQNCCSMPFMLEGDRERALKSAAENIEVLSGLADEGYDILFSCPTCSYMFRKIIPGGAYYSEEYQEKAGPDSRYMKVPSEESEKKGDGFLYLDRMIFRKILTDTGYYSSIDPLKRIAVAENSYDAGEYLLKTGFLEKDLNYREIHLRMAYYPPCHLREQKKGTPYINFLRKIPGSDVQSVEGTLSCCGISGIMGYKKNFHFPSLELGQRLVDRINDLDPEIIVTDCLSCRLQFNQLTDYEVYHPLEILRKSIC